MLFFPIQGRQPRVRELLGNLAIYEKTLPIQKKRNKLYEVLNYSSFLLKFEEFTRRKNVI